MMKTCEQTIDTAILFPSKAKPVSYKKNPDHLKFFVSNLFDRDEKICFSFENKSIFVFLKRLVDLWSAT